MTEGLTAGDSGNLTPLVDNGNTDIRDGHYGEVHISRGVLRMPNGAMRYIITFRNGVSTFSLPFPNVESMRGFAAMIGEDADAMDANIPKPSGLLVPTNAGRLIK